MWLLNWCALFVLALQGRSPLRTHCQRDVLTKTLASASPLRFPRHAPWVNSTQHGLYNHGILHELDTRQADPSQYTLFAADPPVDYLDVIQGPVGNCFLIAAVKTLAYVDPQRIQDLVKVSGKLGTKVDVHLPPDGAKAKSQDNRNKCVDLGSLKGLAQGDFLPKIGPNGVL